MSSQLEHLHHCGGMVLVVDDDPTVQLVLAAALRMGGYEVGLASQGHQAIEFYRRYLDKVAVVLLDVRMPGLDGPHTLIALQKLCSTVRCCFMTGDPSPYTEEELAQMGAHRVFRKPFAITDILDTLKQLLSSCNEP
jgi:DNA-binding NtrC family response regulator